MFPVVDASGTAVERGRIHVEQARDRVERSLANYARLFSFNGMAWDEAQRRAAPFRDVIGSFDASLLEEIEGIARGAGRIGSEILALNARTELLPSQYLTGKDDGECTAIAVSPAASATGGTLLAQNWDWLGAQRAALVLLRVRDAARTLDAPQLGARVRLGLGFETLGNWSRSGRAPEFDELFGIDGSVTGNPALLPERAENWDAGLRWAHATGALRLSAEWSHHASHVHDLVLFERSSPRGARPVNVGVARLFGEESTLRAGWRGAELSASTAWLSATDRSPIAFYLGRRLPQRSARQSFARLAWHGRAWTAAGQAEYLGDTFLDRANYHRAPSRTLFGASLGRRLGRLLVLAEGRNLGDRLAEDVAGFPLPGRMFLFSLSLDLGEHASHP